MFVPSALNQVKIAIDTSIQILNQYTESDLKIQPIESKRSLFEMCTHLSLICHADLLILNGITEKELHTFYIEQTPETITQMQQTMIQGYDLLSKTFLSYSNEELAEIMTAYWGISYSRFEWLLEIVAHFYHHRGQIHVLLVEHIKDPKISLFE
ncbi:DinB family protein [Bacillus mycoides]|uniref:DinB family protein n=1 Tax=Bacillus mycoides TaxID=1405 RepID=UPI00103DAC1F|nr:DinB family protein [Bacillus mycoides]QWG33259.1 DinB family protein [Bacillus mycoides]QWG44707.1 DinB family protein [Bacillus mycoides]QWH11772.1 DinB family protein [Bacillus mycoides]TBX78501.1 DinB family protein [Bacillus mycoides]